MFDCFICKINIVVYKVFLKHLKNVHNLTENSTYKCMFPNCFRSYDTKNSFTKHLKKKHIDCENNENADFFINSGIDCLFTSEPVTDIILDGFSLNGMYTAFKHCRVMKI